jgi:hypothetical protein
VNGGKEGEEKRGVRDISYFGMMTHLCAVKVCLSILSSRLASSILAFSAAFSALCASVSYTLLPSAHTQHTSNTQHTLVNRSMFSCLR